MAKINPLIPHRNSPHWNFLTLPSVARVKEQKSSWTLRFLFPFWHGRQIEGKVVEISRLQEIFAEKVLHQVSLIALLRRAAECFRCSAASYLFHQTGNGDKQHPSAGRGRNGKRQRGQRGHPRGRVHLEEVNFTSCSCSVTKLTVTPPSCVLSLKAIKNNAGFRVWILFFLVMCSFSLLFLDWYDS